MIQARQLLSDLQARQKKLDNDLRQQVNQIPELKARLQADYHAAREAERTAHTFNAWLDHELTQAAVAWLLACTFVRFCEDNGLLLTPRLSGPGDALRRARDAASEYFRQNPTLNERHYLQHVFDEVADIPALAGLFGREHNPLFGLPLSFEAARDLLAFWQQVDPDTGALRHDFTDATLDTRFLGDLYQDLSEAARKRYALLQTPDFVEAFILDRTLEPAIQRFGLQGVRMIDPTCGSGHFLLSGFQRLLGHWQHDAPGLDAREHVIHALAGVYGVDLNPFAVAIARFRLLVAALQASGIRTLREAPGWQFNLAVGDSLLHGPRLGGGELALEETGIAEEYRHVYASEDADALHRILGQRYHAVVGNPPYITASDKSLNALYRKRYKTCHGKFSLGVPFTERFFQLARPEENSASAGFVGLITADSFMKREFGKKLIEEWLPQQDLTHLIHTSGAYIPGHGTPTVILLGRNRAPVSSTVRAVLGIRGEPSTPADPAQGLVWRSIVELTDQPGTSNEFISVLDMERARLATHPWSLQGGVAPEVLQVIETNEKNLGRWAEHIGIGAVTGCDDALLFENTGVAERHGLQPTIPLMVGERIRNWSAEAHTALSVYTDEWAVRPLYSMGRLADFLWIFRSVLDKRRRFGTAMVERGLAWYEFQELYVEKLRAPLSITFAFVATHNHFVLDRGGKVFKQSAPVIKLPADASEDQHLGLLGLLNSSTACFWFKQVFFNKGMGEEYWADRFEHDSTKLLAFPLAETRPLELARQLDSLATQRQAHLPAALATKLPLSRAALDGQREQAQVLLTQMIALQEELDWWCYRAYGLLDDELTFAGQPPGIMAGERAFEIVLARRMAAGTAQTRWFERHGSTPITDLPVHWPADYRALVQRRIERIESNEWIDLLEQPEYKRRWQQTSWPALEQAALKGWLLDRLETPRYWPQPTLQNIAQLAAHAERDADFMAVAALYTGRHAFEPAALVAELLADESVPALKVLRYKDSGLRKRADWEHTWQQQRREDAIDAAVAAAHPREAGESEADWQARIKPKQDARKLDELGRLPAPPKYRSVDFLRPGYWRLRGGLDVPKERFFTVPDPQDPAQWLYGWAGHNPAQRAQALAGAFIDAEQRSGADPAQLLPLLIALDEELPWILQWHNAIDPDTDVRLGDYFTTWLAQQLNRHTWTRQTLAEWQPAGTLRPGRRRAAAAKR